jgi:hypothetical protein
MHKPVTGLQPRGVQLIEDDHIIAHELSVQQGDWRQTQGIAVCNDLPNA